MEKLIKVMTYRVVAMAITVYTVLATSLWSHAGTAQSILPDYVLTQKSEAAFTLAADGRAAPIIIDSDDFKGVVRAADDLARDIELVTGASVAVNPPLSSPAVIIGTIGNSKYIDELIESGQLDVTDIEGQWESYIIQTIDGNLVIVGSDKRGTIYGIYDVSEKIGVSPWHYWADVPVKKSAQLYVANGRYRQPSPSVKYRGIFINDEWPSFGTWANNQFGGINSKMYATIFELLLRLKANYLWPAMWASAFNEDDPETQRLADVYGIVMGTSHHEPMMRAHKEYTRRRDSIGAWDFRNNHDNIVQFFTQGVERAKDYDNIITIGMRGDGDVALGKDDAECMETLTDVIATQRDIIEGVYGRPASEVPQLWAIFTEVQRYYDAGFNVPDDVTLLFCDNNWGYIRRTGPEKERNRKGGMGLYYHIDMNGGPWNDRWVNTTTAAKLREQLNLAYQTGLDRIWIINVGDLKPKEMPIDFIMKYAWCPDAYPADKAEGYMVDWARGIFGGEHAREIADIVTEYSKLNLERKPEVQRVGIYSAATGEAQRMMQRWDDLEKRTLALSTKIPAEYQDAFYELVEYPAVASAGVAKMYLAATMGDAKTVKTLFERDSLMTARYNKEIASGKWDGMMLDKHIGYTKWSMPEHNVAPAAVECHLDLTQCVEPDEISIMACDYTRRSASDDAQWTFLPGLGRGRGCMGASKVTAQSRPDGTGAVLEYDVETPHDGACKLALGILPTNDINPARGLRIAAAIDDMAPIIVDARQGYVDEFREYNEANIARSGVLKPLPKPASDIYLAGVGEPMRNEIFDNLRWLSIDLGPVAQGSHTIKIIMVDPEIVVEKLIINPDNHAPSYYGS